jgi:hypothetical protein
MTPTNLLSDTYAIEVPEGAENIRISQLIGTPKIFADIPGYLWAAKLPEGSWQIICTTKEVKASHAPVLFGYAMIGDHEAQETARALVASKGLDPDKTLIIKKVS